MTLTVKDSPTEAGPGKPGSPSQSTVDTSSASTRSNPVCLEVPVVVRSLPGEQGTAGGASGPSREEGRTVIVFDNGAVLRISNQLPPGQKLIVSNQKGRDVVCRVMGGRTPTKGYIEVEFIEPVVDFWNIHQVSEPAKIPSPQEPAIAPPQAATEEPPPAAIVTSPVEIQARKPTASSGSAPTFEDIAGLVNMSPRSAAPPASQDQKEKKIEKRVESAPYSANLKARDELASGLTDTGKYISSVKSAPSNPEPRFEELPAPQVRETPPYAPQTQASSSTIMGKGLLASPYNPPASAAGESRSRTPLFVGGAALVLLGFGAGYFLMHRGGSPATAPGAIASESSAPAISAAAGAPSPVGQSAVNPPDANPGLAPAIPPVSTTVPVTAAATVQEAAASQNTPRSVNATEAKQADRAQARHQAINNLNMGAPNAPKQNPVKFTDGPALSPLDVNTSVVPGGASSNGLLSSVAHPESVPAPPMSMNSPAPPNKVVREPKLVTSTRPIYPSMAKQTNVQGNVIVTATVDSKGNVVDAKIVSGPQLLRQAALDTVRQWKYSPAQVDGRPATAAVTVSLDFRLK